MTEQATREELAAEQARLAKLQDRLNTASSVAGNISSALASQDEEDRRCIDVQWPLQLPISWFTSLKRQETLSDASGGMFHSIWHDCRPFPCAPSMCNDVATFVCLLEEDAPHSRAVSAERYRTAGRLRVSCTSCSRRQSGAWRCAGSARTACISSWVPASLPATVFQPRAR